MRGSDVPCKCLAWKIAPCPIRDLFLQADLADLIAVFVPETKQHWFVRTTACKYLAERYTAQWVARQNFSIGRAPTGCMLVDQFVAQLQRFGFQARFGMDPPRTGQVPKIGTHGQEVVPADAAKMGLAAGTSAGKRAPNPGGGRPEGAVAGHAFLRCKFRLRFLALPAS